MLWLINESTGKCSMRKEPRSVEHNTLGEPYSMKKVHDLFFFFLFVSLSRCDSFCTLIFHFAPQPRSLPLVRSMLYVGNIAPITQILSKFTQDSRFQFRNAINLFQAVITSLHQFYQAPVLTLTWCQNIWFKVMTAISKPTVPRTPPPKVCCIEINTALVTKCLSLIPSDVVFNVFLCVLALRALLLTRANIEMLKENTGAVWGPPPPPPILISSSGK